MFLFLVGIFGSVFNWNIWLCFWQEYLVLFFDRNICTARASLTETSNLRTCSWIRMVSVITDSDRIEHTVTHCPRSVNNTSLGRNIIIVGKQKVWFCSFPVNNSPNGVFSSVCDIIFVWDNGLCHLKKRRKKKKKRKKNHWWVKSDQAVSNFLLSKCIPVNYT